MSKPATQQQINFINTLQIERNVPAKLTIAMRELWDNGVFSDTVANGYIQAMLRFEVNEQAVARHMAMVGYHTFEDTVYRVYRSQNGHMYIKRLTFDANGKAKMVYAETKVAQNLGDHTRLNDTAVKRVEFFLKNK